MLSLYYQPNISDEVDLMADAIWFDVLSDVPQEAISLACCEWERNEEKRPTPAGIRKRALARVEKPASKPKPTEAPRVVIELDRRREIAAELGLPIIPVLKSMTKCEGEAC